jgi:hypothetical protein
MSDNSGYAAFVMFQSLKLHFQTESYDYIKYHGKVGHATKDKFEKRKDKYAFYKISRKYSIQEMKEFYVANFISDGVGYIGDITGPEGEEHYRKWQKRNQSLTYIFEADIMYIFDKHKNFLKVPHGGYPKLLCELMEGNITPESMVILNNLMKFLPIWKEKIVDDIVFPNCEMLIRKYSPFVLYDENKCKLLLKEKIEEYAKA